MPMHRNNFAPAAPEEDIVHGACRPGYGTSNPADHVKSWINRMQDNGIQRICCLLDDKLKLYDGLIGTYEATFGGDAVCHSPISDYTGVSAPTLHEVILPFLECADAADEPVVVHCSAGMGRTGHVLALWLAHVRGYTVENAVQTVKQSGRSPLEAVTRERLQELLAR